MVPAVTLFEMPSGKRLGWFAGPPASSVAINYQRQGKELTMNIPAGELVFDLYLYAFDPKHGFSAWDVETGERVFVDAAFCPAGYHTGSQTFVTALCEGVFRVSRLVE
jgi:hypothetical protein